METLRRFFGDFSDRRPGIFGLMLVLLLTLAPAIFVTACYFVFGYDFNSARIVLIFTFFLELAMLFWTDRPVMIAAPFLISLAGIVLLEIINFLVPAFGALAGEGAYEMSVGAVNIGSYVLMTVFGSEVTGCFSAVPAYFLLKLGIFIYVKIRYRGK